MPLIDSATAPPSSGTKLFIGPIASPAASIEDYEGFQYDEIKELMDVGEFGEQFEVVPYNSLALRRTRKRKGTYDPGDMVVQMGHDLVNDDGQIKLAENKLSDASFAFKLELNDAPEDGTPTTYYYVAKIMGYRPNVGGVNGVVTSQATLGIDSDILMVPAEEDDG